MRLGVFGGTFNPPHIGHMICAQEAYVQLGLDRVLLIPVSTPPHKPLPDDPGPELRLELCRAAISGDEGHMEASDLEVARGGTSFSLDTLNELTSRAPDSTLFLILGGDAAAGLPSWHEPERVLALAAPALACRPGTSSAQMTAALSSLSGGERAVSFEMPNIAISSTMIRERVAAGLPIRYLVPDGVAACIKRRGLYTGGERA